MTFESDYNLLETMSKRFRLDDNAVKTGNQRVASIANNSNLERDRYTANMISKIIQRTASINSKIDEVGLLQRYMQSTAYTK